MEPKESIYNKDVESSSLPDTIEELKDRLMKQEEKILLLKNDKIKLQQENRDLNLKLKKEKESTNSLKISLDNQNNLFRQFQEYLSEFKQQTQSQFSESGDKEFAEIQKTLEGALKESQKIHNEMVGQKEYLEYTLSALKESYEEIGMQKQYLELTIQELEINKAALDEKTKSLESAFEELDRVYTDLESSIRYARRIQKSMLPRTKILTKNFEDSFILLRPRDVVSGDFYWYSKVDDKIIVAAVDCTGHGVPGAIMSVIGINFLNSIINKRRILSPELILDTLHSEINTVLNQDTTHNRDGMDIAICVIDKANNTLEYAGAHNPLVYMQEGQAFFINGDRIGVGGSSEDRIFNFQKHIISIEKPTTFYIYSDGYQDEFGGPRGKKFMSGKFKDLLFQIHEKKMVEQKKILDETMQEWLVGYQQIDDILVIGVKI